MRKTLLIVSLLLSIPLSGCKELTDLVRVLGSSIGQQPVNADEVTGFNPSISYPHRNHTYDVAREHAAGLSQWQLDKLFNHVAMPQSESAITSILGYWDYSDGDWRYWKIDGGSSELAMKFRDSKAQTYTVGY